MTKSSETEFLPHHIHSSHITVLSS